MFEQSHLDRYFPSKNGKQKPLRASPALAILNCLTIRRTTFIVEFTGKPRGSVVSPACHCGGDAQCIAVLQNRLGRSPAISV